MSGSCGASTVEDLVNPTFGANKLHIGLARRLQERWYFHLDPSLLMPSALDAIVHESDQASRYNYTSFVRGDVAWRRGVWTYSARSFMCRLLIFSSNILNVQGGTHPPLASSSSTSAEVCMAGDMFARGMCVPFLTK